MIDARLWSSVPHRNPTALLDFYGQFALWHEALAATIVRATGTTIRVYPLGDGGGRAWRQSVQQQHANAAAALGLAPPPDLVDYSMDKADDHASFFWVLSQDATRLALAAGLV